MNNYNRDRDRPRGSNQEITVEQYGSTLPYEMMQLKEMFFQNIAGNDNIKRIINPALVEPITAKNISDALKKYRDEFNKKKNKQIVYDGTLNNDIINREILYNLLQYRFSELYNSPEEIVNAKSALMKETDRGKVKMTKDDIIAEKSKLKGDIKTVEGTSPLNEDNLKTAQKGLVDFENNEKISENRTLYILPTIYSTSNQSINTYLHKDIKEPYRTYYADIFNSANNNIFFLPVRSLNEETIDAFKSRIDQELIKLADNIKNRGREETTAYNKIIYFIDNPTDKNMFTGFFTKPVKKEYAKELNSKLKNFFVTRIERQLLRLNNNIFFSDIKALKSDTIIRNLRNVRKASYIIDLNDNVFKSAIEMLLESLKNCYLSYTDEEARKSLTENQNVNKFDIYLRLENLDDTVPINSIVASNEYFYLFLENKKLPRVGYFEVSNLSKNQYFFVLDRTKGQFKKWKSAVFTDSTKAKIDQVFKKGSDGKPTVTQKYLVEDENGVINIKTANGGEPTLIKSYKYGDMIDFNKDEDWTWSDEYTRYATDKKSNDEEDEDEDEDPVEEEKSDKNVSRILIEVRYNLGQIQFQNIQNSLTDDFNNNVIKFLTTARPYEQYQWFNFNTIDRTFDKSKTSINYYSDTLFDKASLTAFLKSENKLPEKPRYALEFLKLNNNLPDLKKYSNFIFDNFKSNINKNVNDRTFQDRIKENILDIVFDKGGLIYIKPINIVSEKEKEQASADNYKILNYKYVNVRSVEDSKAVDNEINNYFTKNSAEEAKKLKDKNKNINEVKTVFKQNKHTGAFAIVQITRDLTGDTSNLLLAAECKNRSRRIQTKLQSIIGSIVGGKPKRRTKRKRKITRKRIKKYYRT